ncbi:MAG: hypothetical protein WAW09_01450 [Smithella sp.]
MRNCPGDGIDMVPKSQYSNVQAPACQFNCPAGIDIREYVKLLNDGASLAEAWKVLTRNNPFPRSYRQSMSPDDLRKQFTWPSARRAAPRSALTVKKAKCFPALHF